MWPGNHMKKNIHIEITKTALGGTFGEPAIELICLANVGQDALIYQLGHDQFHVDNNSFAAAEKFRSELQLHTVAAIQSGDMHSAWRFFGKLAHTVQDFYAHSNYVELYLAKYPGKLPEDMDPMDESLIHSDALISGKLYYPFEVITFFKGLPNRILEMFPADSHAKLNKDHPGRIGFEHARQAAIYRTWLEFLGIKKMLSDDETTQFCGKNKERE